ncbi:dTMP kinase [Candidatus Palibaumannia cicadellinicola]|uniref:Thymidylate kinase n=1 Tax=Baumannia cicadellinicola subsp. Homalodisca coagulata TaxID=374463 RepID=KTHY_BAUCH|nr:dTMP kinase [Candidatus Baumannia cicadellinicola]Q1LT42.1 RecName: Full=Thymidylate kinase; AltName: Full=dTMP kinase [Baumannia cicadellinicola str. Hc (Homalodisca coagulata)]ABF14009.1 thymidylate kinase [Baumannia cicadellinicola str. Hc (Homalodisca coagulata)]MBS0032802.1 dTMP kinase [Candidatus Baumannia cicadellinicola]MBS0032853.1 dTMP kinase [Candidatus Baumannia cicadellinicola]MCJ7462088.1 dTMP kinase [Candidatus Baumannia cicadellinicola]MCJ7462617.1 dTMP kinase [Candidatus B
MKSKFIVIEGLEGAGKTSVIQQIITILHSNGIHNIISTRDPGGTPLAETIRDIIKKGMNGEYITDYTELLLLYAARTQLVAQVIKPALMSGTWVISDRYDLSSQAYQGGGRGIDIRLLQNLRDAALGKFYPDLTIYLDLPPSKCRARIRARGIPLDRIEMESLSFFQRTSIRYRELVANDSRIITIDAQQSIAELNATIRNNIERWLKSQQK